MSILLEHTDVLSTPPKTKMLFLKEIAECRYRADTPSSFPLRLHLKKYSNQVSSFKETNNVSCRSLLPEICLTCLKISWIPIAHWVFSIHPCYNIHNKLTKIALKRSFYHPPKIKIEFPICDAEWPKRGPGDTTP